MRIHLKAPMQERTNQVLTYGAVAAVACVVALCLSPGARGTPDSTNYLNAATHLLAGHGHVTGRLMGDSAHDFTPVTVFPPGFSLILAALLSSGLGGPSAMSWLLGASYIAYALGACLLLRASLPAVLRWAAPVLTIAIVVQPPVLDSLHMALSDLLGAGLALATVSLGLKPIRDNRHARWLGLLMGGSIWIR